MTTVLIAAAGLLISNGLASAQSQTPRNYDSSGAPQTSGSQQRSGGDVWRPYNGFWRKRNDRRAEQLESSGRGLAKGLTTSTHQVSENGGAPNSTAPSGTAR